jgi:class 3 adenylate cyclase
LEDTTDLSGEMARLAEEAGDLDMAALSQMLRMGVALYATDRAKLDAAVTEIARLATESRSPFHYANAAIGHACVAFLEGRYEDGERYANEVLGHGRRLRDRGMVVNYGLMIYPMYRERGMLGVLEEPTRRAADRSGLRSWRVGLIHILSETGKREEASAEMDAIAAAGWDDWPNDTARRYGLCTLAEIAAGLGHADSARGILPLLRPAADGAAALGPGTYHGAVNRYIGLAQLAIGDRDGACASLERALATETLMRARPWIARTQYDLARALIGRAGPGDRERAVRTLNDTLQMANEIGMPVLSEQALAVKLEIQGIASSSPQHSIDMVAAGVSVERPDLSHDTGVDGRVTIVFSDIEGYTATVERLGDDRSQVLLRDHDRLVRQAVASHNGRVVKSQGDGFMMAFTSPADALGCAVDVQLAIEGHDFGGEEVHLRIGVHAGSVIHEGDDFFGRTVILAARVADSASGGEILTTSEIREAVPHLRYGPGRAVALKGLTGTHTVYPVAWRAAP